MPSNICGTTRSGDVSLLLSAILGGPACISNLSKALRARRHANLAARVNSCINDLKEAKGIRLVQKNATGRFLYKKKEATYLSYYNGPELLDLLL